MLDYRLYFLDRNGHIGHALTFACADDAEALQRAESCRDGRDMELWQQARLVRALPGESRTLSPLPLAGEGDRA